MENRAISTKSIRLATILSNLVIRHRIGTIDAINNPDVSYKIIGSFQEPSGLLTFTGKETTTDAFFKQRFGFNK